MSLKVVLMGIIAGLTLATGAFALERADERVLIVIFDEGAPDETVLHWTRAELEALEQVEFDTTTIWTEGMQNFSGPTLFSVLEASREAGSEEIAEGAMIRAEAANGYFVEIPFAEIAEDYPVIAVKRNGEYFEMRHNGPLWVVYPYDAARDFRTEVALGRSIWQLVSFTITD
jgi:hypothetical protein